jgi:hypothetical protein
MVWQLRWLGTCWLRTRNSPAKNALIISILVRLRNMCDTRNALHSVLEHLKLAPKPAMFERNNEVRPWIGCVLSGTLARTGGSPLFAPKPQLRGAGPQNIIVAESVLRDQAGPPASLIQRRLHRPKLAQVGGIV